MLSVREKFSKTCDENLEKLTRTDTEEELYALFIDAMMEIELFEIRSRRIKNDKERKENQREVTQKKQTLIEKYEKLAESKSFSPIKFEIQNNVDKVREKIQFEGIELEEIHEVKKGPGSVGPKKDILGILDGITDLGNSELAQEVRKKVEVIQIEFKSRKHPWSEVIEKLNKLKYAEVKAKEDYDLELEEAVKKIDFLNDSCNKKQEIRSILYEEHKKSSHALLMIKGYLEDAQTLGKDKMIEVVLRKEIMDVLQLSNNLNRAIKIVQIRLNRYKGNQVEKKQIQAELDKLYEPAMLDSSDHPKKILNKHLLQFILMLENKKKIIHESHIEGLFASLTSSKLETELDKIVKELRITFKLPEAQKESEEDKSNEVSNPGPKAKG